MTWLLGILLLLRGTSSGGTKAPGRKQKAATRRAQARLPDLSRYYRGHLGEVEPGAFEFNVQLVRTGRAALTIDKSVISVEWTDDENSLTGTLTLQRPDPDDASDPPVLAGQRIRLRVRYRGGWYTLWTMRCAPPSAALESGQITVEVSDELDALRRNRRDWTFRRTKRRKVGFRADQIARSAARREGVRVRRLAKGKYRLKKLVRKDTSALSIIAEAYKHERDKTGHRFVIRMINGKLEVVPYRRNRVLYVIRNEITAALAEAEQKSAHPVTVIDAEGRVGKGKKAEKVKSRVYRKAVVRRYGWLVRKKNYGHVDSHADLRRKASRDLAEAIRPKRTATLSLPGIPFIRRGDGARWLTTEPGWHGKEVKHSKDRSYVYVSSASHSVSSDGYTMELVVKQEDPFYKDQKRLDQEARDRAKARRKARRK